MKSFKQGFQVDIPEDDIQQSITLPSEPVKLPTRYSGGNQRDKIKAIPGAIGSNRDPIARQKYLDDKEAKYKENIANIGVDEETKERLAVEAREYVESMPSTKVGEKFLQKEDGFSWLDVINKGFDYGIATYEAAISRKYAELVKGYGVGDEEKILKQLNWFTGDMGLETKSIEEKAEFQRQVAMVMRDRIYAEIEKEDNPIKSQAGVMAAYLAKMVTNPIDLGTAVAIDLATAGLGTTLKLGKVATTGLRMAGNATDEYFEEIREQDDLGEERNHKQAAAAGVAGAVLGEALGKGIKVVGDSIGKGQYFSQKAAWDYEAWNRKRKSPEGKMYSDPDSYKTRQAQETVANLKANEAVTGIDKTKGKVEELFLYNGVTLPSIRNKADIARGRAILDIYNKKMMNRGTFPSDPGKLFTNWKLRQDTRNVATGKIFSLPYYKDKLEALELDPVIKDLKYIGDNEMKMLGDAILSNSEYEASNKDIELYKRKSKSILSANEELALKKEMAENDYNELELRKEAVEDWFIDNHEDLMELEDILRAEVDPNFGVYDYITEYHPHVKMPRDMFYNYLTKPNSHYEPVKSPEQYYLSGINLEPGPRPVLGRALVPSPTRELVSVDDFYNLEDTYNPIGGIDFSLEHDTPFWLDLEREYKSIDQSTDYLIENTPEANIEEARELVQDIKDIESGEALVTVDEELLKKLVFDNPDIQDNVYPENKIDVENSQNQQLDTETQQESNELKEILNNIDALPFGIEPDTIIVDWGKDRTQGKRVGRMVKGSMAAPPKGEVKYRDDATKPYKDDFKEGEKLIPNGEYAIDAFYNKFRGLGWDHDKAYDAANLLGLILDKDYDPIETYKLALEKQPELMEALKKLEPVEEPKNASNIEYDNWKENYNRKFNVVREIELSEEIESQLNSLPYDRKLDIEGGKAYRPAHTQTSLGKDKFLYRHPDFKGPRVLAKNPSTGKWEVLQKVTKVDDKPTPNTDLEARVEDGTGVAYTEDFVNKIQASDLVAAKDTKLRPEEVEILEELSKADSGKMEKKSFEGSENEDNSRVKTISTMRTFPKGYKNGAFDDYSPIRYRYAPTDKRFIALKSPDHGWELWETKKEIPQDTRPFWKQYDEIVVGPGDIANYKEYSRYFSGIHMDSEGATKRRIEGIADNLNNLYNEHKKHIDDNDTELLKKYDEAFNDFKDKYIAKQRQHMASHGSYYTAMIAGPARYPAARMERKFESLMKKSDEISNYFDRNSKRLEKIAKNEVKEKALDNRVAGIEKEFIRGVGNFIGENLERKEKGLKGLATWPKDGITRQLENLFLRVRKDPTLADKFIELVNLMETEAKKYGLKPIFTKKHKIYRWLAEVEEIKNKPAPVVDSKPVENDYTYNHKGEGFEIVDDADEERIKIFHDEIPDPEIRTWLKKNGFRWSRTNKAWQRHNNLNGIAAAKRYVEEFEGKQEVVVEPPKVKEIDPSNDDLHRQALEIKYREWDKFINKEGNIPQLRSNIKHILENLDYRVAEINRFYPKNTATISSRFLEKSNIYNTGNAVNDFIDDIVNTYKKNDLSPQGPILRNMLERALFTKGQIGELNLGITKVDYRKAKAQKEAETGIYKKATPTNDYYMELEQNTYNQELEKMYDYAFYGSDSLKVLFKKLPADVIKMYSDFNGMKKSEMHEKVYSRTFKNASPMNRYLMASNMIRGFANAIDIFGHRKGFGELGSEITQRLEKDLADIILRGGDRLDLTGTYFEKKGPTVHAETDYPIMNFDFKGFRFQRKSRILKITNKVKEEFANEVLETILNSKEASHFLNQNLSKEKMLEEIKNDIYHDKYSKMELSKGRWEFKTDNSNGSYDSNEIGFYDHTVKEQVVQDFDRFLRGQDEPIKNPEPKPVKEIGWENVKNIYAGSPIEHHLEENFLKTGWQSSDGFKILKTRGGNKNQYTGLETPTYHIVGLDGHILESYYYNSGRFRPTSTTFSSVEQAMEHAKGLQVLKGFVEEFEAADDFTKDDLIEEYRLKDFNKSVFYNIPDGINGPKSNKKKDLSAANTELADIVEDPGISRDLKEKIEEVGLYRDSRYQAKLEADIALTFNQGMDVALKKNAIIKIFNVQHVIPFNATVNEKTSNFKDLLSPVIDGHKYSIEKMFDKLREQTLSNSVYKEIILDGEFPKSDVTKDLYNFIKEIGKWFDFFQLDSRTGDMPSLTREDMWLSLLFDKPAIERAMFERMGILKKLDDGQGGISADKLEAMSKDNIVEDMLIIKDIEAERIDKLSPAEKLRMGPRIKNSKLNITAREMFADEYYGYFNSAFERLENTLKRYPVEENPQLIAYRFNEAKHTVPVEQLEKLANDYGLIEKSPSIAQFIEQDKAVNPGLTPEDYLEDDRLSRILNAQRFYANMNQSFKGQDRNPMNGTYLHDFGLMMSDGIIDSTTITRDNMKKLVGEFPRDDRNITNRMLDSIPNAIALRKHTGQKPGDYLKSRYRYQVQHLYTSQSSKTVADGVWKHVNMMTAKERGAFTKDPYTKTQSLIQGFLNHQKLMKSVGLGTFNEIGEFAKVQVKAQMSGGLNPIQANYGSLVNIVKAVAIKTKYLQSLVDGKFLTHEEAIHYIGTTQSYVMQQVHSLANDPAGWQKELTRRGSKFKRAYAGLQGAYSKLNFIELIDSIGDIQATLFTGPIAKRIIAVGFDDIMEPKKIGENIVWDKITGNLRGNIKAAGFTKQDFELLKLIQETESYKERGVVMAHQLHDVVSPEVYSKIYGPYAMESSKASKEQVVEAMFKEGVKKIDNLFLSVAEDLKFARPPQDFSKWKESQEAGYRLAADYAAFYSATMGKELLNLDRQILQSNTENGVGHKVNFMNLSHMTRVAFSVIPFITASIFLQVLGNTNREVEDLDDLIEYPGNYVDNLSDSFDDGAFQAHINATGEAFDQWGGYLLSAPNSLKYTGAKVLDGDVTTEDIAYTVSTMALGNKLPRYTNTITGYDPRYFLNEGQKPKRRSSGGRGRSSSRRGNSSTRR